MRKFDTVVDQGLLTWLLRKLADQLPGVVLAKALDSIDALSDPRTPSLKRALLVTAILELLGVVRINRALSIILKFSLLHATFVASERYFPPPPAPTLPVPAAPPPVVPPAA